MEGRDDVNSGMRLPINPRPTFLTFENLPLSSFLLHHVITSEKEEKSSVIPKQRHWMLLLSLFQHHRPSMTSAEPV